MSVGVQCVGLWECDGGAGEMKEADGHSSFGQCNEEGSRGSLVLSRRSTHQETGCSGRDEAAAGRGTAPSTLSQSVDYWKRIQLDQAAVREFYT